MIHVHSLTGSKEMSLSSPQKIVLVSMELERKSQSVTVKSFILTDFQHMSNKEINSLLSLNPGPPLRACVKARLSNSLIQVNGINYLVKLQKRRRSVLL